MRLHKLVFSVLGVAAVIGQARPAAAYDPRHTHRWIARQAAEHLRTLFPGQYDELLPYLEDFVAGVEEEDDILLDGDDDPLTIRVMRHFYRPTDGEGLTMETFGHFPSSYEWTALPSEQNEWGWDDALRYYQAGEPEKAFRAAGHVVHLIQDATVPAHVHLDAHGPPSGDSYENWCSAQMRSEFDGDLVAPAPGTPLPEFDELEEIWQLTASASYWRNMYPGALSDITTAEASGVLAQMFPTIKVDWRGQWVIPEVGALGAAFWEEEPGLFYFKKAIGIGAVDRIGFDSAMPDALAFGDNSDDAAMTELMARDLVPIAILSSAAILKKFMDEARTLDVVEPGSPGEPADEDPTGCQAGGGADLGTLGLLLGLLPFIRRRRTR